MFSKKFGREFINNFIPPISIIVFYLSKVSIIVPLLSKVNIGIDVGGISDETKVAIDSAIVTLITDIILFIANSPITLDIKTRNYQDLDEVITYRDRPVHIEYIIVRTSRANWIKRLYYRLGKPTLRILNSRYTTIVLDKEKEYEGSINSDNSSKYIEIDLTQLSDAGSSYFKLSIMSNKSIKWDDEIRIELYLRGKKASRIHYLFWEISGGTIKIVHREEQE